MNEVEELLKIETASLPKLKPFLFDDLHQKVHKNMYLELGSGPVLFLLTSTYSVANPTPTEPVSELITKKIDLLNHLKEFICQNLCIYSVLLDVNSYFIEQNSFLVIARLRERDSEGRRYEIKFYTNSPLEVVKNYKDKIYIGRDFIDLFQCKRKYFGLKEFITSLKEQNQVLLEKAEQKMRRPVKYKSFFQEISEYVNELHSESFDILQSLPPYLDVDAVSGNDLIDINAQYRSINHYLIELRDEVEEFENLLFKGETAYARYVTKFKKDIANLISYFNIRINGWLSDKIYGIKAKH